MKMALYCENVPTPVGTLCVCSDGEAVTGIRFGAGETNGGCPVTGQARQQLTEYFAGQRREFDLPLAPAGTDFQRRVWELLREIPYGETVTYGELARRPGNPKSARAVGMACNRNPIAIVVPCHRVVGSTGSLMGYAGGLDAKAFLLKLEGVLPHG
ncbi:MAG: methylated-DNA--[protein]-cysteine S-methyltransferase [Oscillospiraceae bacterium]|nr:methylated-DNA--[protein]-cysteine S-methyltransferase [Oscillospiraceae bacterium]